MIANLEAIPVDRLPLIGFLYHLKYDWITPSACDELERRAVECMALDELHNLDPFTLASAAALAERLLGGGEGEGDGETADDDLCGVDRPSVGEREDEQDGD